MAATGTAARRYAEALLALAADDRAVSAYRASLEKLGGALDRATVAGLRDPGVPLRVRQDALAEAAQSEPAEIRSFLVVLLERDRIALVPLIARAFGEIVDRRAGIGKALITTAIPLSERERDLFVSRLEGVSGRKLRATFAVDPSLIGGAKVQIGDHLVDSSLDAKLSVLRQQLAS